MHRRQFLQQAGLFSASSLVAIAGRQWLTPAQAATTNPPRLIVIFLRGAVDGLSVVVPHSDPTYYTVRPRIAIPQPGQTGGALNLDGRFGLHPSLAPLLPLWQQKSLAFVHACGSPDPSRSHFDAQAYMEIGVPGSKRVSDGWMNRLLSVLSNHSPIQAVNVGPVMPRILSGKMPVASLSGDRKSSSRFLNRPQVGSAFDRLYSDSDPLSRTYQEGRVASQALAQDLETEMKMANNGARLPNLFAKDAQKLAKAMVKDPRIELAFMAVGGWDTHVNQGNSKGQLATHLDQLGKGLATLQQSLGSLYANTTILVMSEFGRTVRENGNGGTDHGHGNVIWAMGGNVQGGKVYGDWRGLDSNQLYEGRDLAVTTDFRDVVSSILSRHLQLNSTQLTQIFPDYSQQQHLAIV